MEVTAAKLRTAGWWAVVSAMIAIPMVVGQILLEQQGDSRAEIASVVMSIAGLALYIYLMMALRSLLWAKFDFHGIDMLVHVLIGLNVLVVAASSMPDQSETASLATLAGVMVFGVAMIVFGVFLLKLQAELYGLRKTYCYLCIATGVCLVVPILIPLAVLTGIACDGVLAAIFFRAAKA